MKRKRKIVLALSDSHDAGVCIAIDGKIVFAINEERLSRKKNHQGFPYLSIEEGLNACNIKKSNIDNIAVAGESRLTNNITTNNNLRNDDGSINIIFQIIGFLSNFSIIKKFFKSELFLKFYKLVQTLQKNKRRSEIKRQFNKIDIFPTNISFYDHHDCHVFSAYSCSGFKDALVVSNDGMGDGLCSKIYNIKNNKSICLSKNTFYNSLAMVYGYASYLCGFKKNHHAGKTTGLSANGNYKKTYNIFRKYINWNNKIGNYENTKTVFTSSLLNLKKDLSRFNKKDIAAGIQKLTDSIILDQIKFYLKKTNAKNICLVGGLHANVLTNMRIADKFPNKQIFVFPAMHDGGLATGAAYLELKKKKEKINFKIKNYYLGNEYTDKDILIFLEKNKIKFKKPKNLSKFVASLLLKNKIISRFAGRMEYGPRALGNRSILYNAKDKKTNKWLNKKLNRTDTMPFAPVILDEFKKIYVKNYNNNNINSLQNMTICSHSTDICKKRAPAAVHVDGTIRPQIIKKKANPEYYNILKDYYKLSKIPLLINTSFNLHEQPIVSTPEQAYRSFRLSKLDALVLNKFIILK